MKNFCATLKFFIDFVFMEFKQKDALKPFIECKKQLLYYEKISNAHGVKMKDTKSASRLALCNWIMEIIDFK